MKYFKYSILILVAAIITDTVITKAYSTPVNVSVNQDLPANDGVWTSLYTKNTWTSQTYKNVESSTWLTNPCPDCKIAAKPFTSGGDAFVAVITKMGEVKTFTDPTTISSPNDYKLYIYRFDTTLLTTHHKGTWKIN